MKPTDGPRKGQLGLEINWGPLFPFVKLWVPPSAGTSRGHTQARLVRSGPSATLHQTASKDSTGGGGGWGLGVGSVQLGEHRDAAVVVGAP